MDIMQAIRGRRSVRKYKSDPVPEASLNNILEAGRLAPSAWNGQPWKFIVVTDEERRKGLADRAKTTSGKAQEWIAEAPVIVAAVATDTDRQMTNGIESWPVDIAIAVDHMILAAAGEGLGTCWIGAFSEEDVKEYLEVPDEMRVVILFPLGYPADEPKSKKRKNIEEVVCYDRYQE